MFYPLSIILALVILFSGPAEQRRVVTTEWNGMALSMDRQTPVLKELQESYQKYPPWMVNSEAARLGRKEKWKLVIAEGEEQLRRFKKLRDAE